MNTTAETASARPCRLASVATLGAAPAANAPDDRVGAATVSGFEARDAEVNGTRIHYRVGGSGPAVVLLHGYAETSHMWNPLMPLLAKTHTVIVPDLRGAGGSSKPEDGYDKKNMAADIHELVKGSGHWLLEEAPGQVMPALLDFLQ